MTPFLYVDKDGSILGSMITVIQRASCNIFGACEKNILKFLASREYQSFIDAAKRNGNYIMLVRPDGTSNDTAYYLLSIKPFTNIGFNFLGDICCYTTRSHIVETGQYKEIFGRGFHHYGYPISRKELGKY